MSDRETRSFLTRSRSALILGTVNADGSPTIHPVWYYFEPAKIKLYFYTEPDLKKTKNIKRKNLVYFDVDDDRWPYKGVKGKGRAKILSSKEATLFWGRKILAKYTKKASPLFRSAFERMKNGGYIVFEISPAYLTSWDFGKLERGNKGLRESIIQ